MASIPMGRCMLRALSRRAVSRSSSRPSLCPHALRRGRRGASLPLPVMQLSVPNVTDSRVAFHVKGNIYMGTKAFFAAKVQGGLDELYQAIDDPELLAFIQQKFLPCAWYDVLP